MPRWINIQVERSDEPPDRREAKAAGQPRVAVSEPEVRRGGSAARFVVVSGGVALLVVLGIAAAIVLPRRSNSLGADLPATVATVNGEKITREQLIRGVNINQAMYPLAQGKTMNMDPAALRQFESDLLEQMIDNTLLLQEAKKANLTVSEQAIDAEINAMLTNYKITEKQLDDQLAVYGVRRADVREWLGGALLANQLIAQKSSQPTADGQPFNAQSWLNEIQAGADVQVFLTDQGTGGLGAKLGSAAPDFTLKDLDGKEWTLSQLKGQPVMINFWATWCQPCKVEMPLLQKAYEKYKDQGFVILAVDIKGDNGEAAVRKYVEDLKLSFPVVMDTTGQVENAYRVRAYPTSAFVDRNGNLVDTKRGAIVSEAALDQYLAKIMQ